MAVYTIELVTEECYACHIVFGVPAAFHRQRLAGAESGQRDFWCPNGHCQRYTQTEVMRLRADRERLERNLANLRDDLNVERASHAATRGTVTKLRKRVAAGVCPYCHRHFTALERHVATKHKEQPA